MWLISLYVLLGAVAFWLPDILLSAYRANSLLLFTVVPTFGFLAVYHIAKDLRPSTSKPSTAIFMMIGVWLLASTAMMISASFSKGGFAQGIVDTLGVVVLGLIPPYTLIMTAYDGSLLALLITTCLAVGAHFLFELDHWIVPPSLRTRLKRWYERRAVKDF